MKDGWYSTPNGYVHVFGDKASNKLYNFYDKDLLFWYTDVLICPQETWDYIGLESPNKQVAF